MPLTIRFATERDARDIASLFHETVKTINSRDYLPPQIEAWAGEFPDPKKWSHRLASRKTFVAELAGEVVGFAELEGNGHIDAFYVHPAHQREGVGAALAARIEQEAERLGIAILFTEASITAEPFFKKRGFETVREQEVHYGGAVFKNYSMTKTTKAG